MRYTAGVVLLVADQTDIALLEVRKVVVDDKLDLFSEAVSSLACMRGI